MLLQVRDNLLPTGRGNGSEDMADAVSDKGAHRFTVGCEFTRRVDMSGPQLKRISRIGIDFL